MFLVDLCIRRPVFTTMLISMLVVLGLISYSKLGVDLFPNVDIPTVTIRTTLEGASAEEMETTVTKPIEEVVNTIEGIDELRSSTVEGVSQIVVGFHLYRNGDAAAQDVRDKVSTILSKLPEGTDPPVIEKFDIDAAPVMSIAVSGNRDLREVTEIADKMVKQDIETLPGVGAIDMVGGRQRAVNIYVDASKLDSYGLSIAQVKSALQAGNLELPGGRVDQGARELILRTMGRMPKVEDFNNLIVANFQNTPIYVKDIGYVDNGVEEPRSLARLNGVNSVSLVVRKQSGTNTVEVIDGVKRRLTQLSSVLPGDIKLQVVRDHSRFIKRSFGEVRFHLILGGILTSFVVLLFMRNFRATIISAVAIPISIISTFTFMRFMDFTLNNMTMLGLVLAIGIVIDDAIVVLENTFRHIEEKGTPPLTAASEATKEIALAVMATTLSLVVIFLPVAFMSGRVGRFFNSYGIVVAVSIMVSLLISFTLTPMLSSRFLKLHNGQGGAGQGSSSRSKVKTSKESFFYSAIDRFYGAVLQWSLQHRIIVVLLGLVVVVSTVPLFRAIGKDFSPFDDQSEFAVAIQTPEGYTLQSSEVVFKEIEQKLKRMEGVEFVLTSIGESTLAEVTSGSIYVRLVDMEKRNFSQFDAMKKARRLLANYPDLRASVQNVSAVSSSSWRQTAIAFNLRGPDLDQLYSYSDAIIKKAKGIPGLVDVDTTLAARKPELHVNINRQKASDLGVKVADVASVLRTLVGGEKVTKYKEGADQYDVWLRATLPDRNSGEAVYRLSVPTNKGGLIRLSNFVNLAEERGPAQIDRQSRQRQVTIVGNLDNIPLGTAVDKIKEIVRKMELPILYQTDFAGRAKIMEEAMQNFALAFLLSVIFMYMILAAQFESFLHPITIMLALPLSVPFALVSLLFLRESLNIYSIFGLFMLFGIVKKNGILQIDYTNTLRARGLERNQAIIEANHARLRPILMTTLTLIAAMIPLALGTGPGAASRASMAKVIIGGQALSLLLTLVMTPVAYSIFDDIGRLRVGLRVRQWASGTYLLFNGILNGKK